MRRRWTEERRMQREHAEWIVGYLRVHGPMTTRAIIEALSLEGRPIEAHILSRALRKSPFVSCVDKVIVDGQQQSVWAFQIDEN